MNLESVGNIIIFKNGTRMHLLNKLKKRTLKGKFEIVFLHNQDRRWSHLPFMCMIHWLFMPLCFCGIRSVLINNVNFKHVKIGSKYSQPFILSL